MPRLVNIALLAALAAAPAPAATPLRIVCLGDSVTKGVRPGVEDAQTFCSRLEAGLKGAGTPAEVLNAGVGSNTTTLALARLERDVLAKEPTHVVIMFGLNDSWVDPGKTAGRLTPEEYGANLRTMVESIRKRGAIPILMTPNPVSQPTYPPSRNRSMKPHVEAMRALARSGRVPLVDLYAHLAERAIEGDDLNALYTDAMHPNPSGHQLIADLLLAHFRSSAGQ